MGRGQSGSESSSLLFGETAPRYHQGGAAEYGPPLLTTDAANWLDNIIEDIEKLGEWWGIGADFDHEGKRFVDQIDRVLCDLRQKFEDGGREPIPLNRIEKQVLRDAATALAAMEADGRDSVPGDRRKTWRGWAAKDLLASVDPEDG